MPFEVESHFIEDSQEVWMEMHLLLFGSFGSKSKSVYFKIFLEMHDIGLSKSSK